MTQFPEKITAMKEGGALAAQLREQLLESIYPGMKTIELEEQAANFYDSHNVVPSFLGYQDYPHRLVICINDEVVHGMPSERELQPGDLVTVDLGVLHKGFHTDTAKTIEVETDTYRKFLNIGKEALNQAIQKARVGNRIGDISFAIQSVIEDAGYNVIRAFVGHQIGRNLHEELQVPCFGEKGTGPLLEEGMTLAIEVMYVEGSYKLAILEDGWTAVTRDGKQSAMFEHTIAITASGALILTD